MKSLAQALSFSRNALALITSTAMISFLAIEVAKAQPKPSCYMIELSGEVVNLEDICDVKPQRTKKSKVAALEVNNTEDVYTLGNGSLPFTLGPSSRIYYDGRRLAYFRRYYESPRFATRDNTREVFLESGASDSSASISGRTPFIIYRYQK
ncbi:MAG: hypothetical protein WBM44_06715 [Waterburya sp.]